jgi:hypothetical protein
MKWDSRLVTDLTFLLLAGIAEHDSTQPRGSPGGINDHGQSTDPIIDSFRAPVRFFDIGDSQFQNSMGSIMPSSIRDPSVFGIQSRRGLALAAVINAALHLIYCQEK